MVKKAGLAGSPGTADCAVPRLWLTLTSTESPAAKFPANENGSEGPDGPSAEAALAMGEPFW